MPIPLAAALALALAAAQAGPEPGAPEEIPGAEPPAAVPDGAPLARRWIVERIEFVGLERTRPSEARKHVLVREGDLLDDQAVLLSRLRLVQLGWFRRVETRVARGTVRGQVVLVFEVEERNTLLVSDLFIGSTDPQPVYGGLGLAEHNFLGRGLGLAGAFVYGGTPSQQPLAPTRLSLRGAFTAPDVEFLGVSAHLGVSALWMRGEELTCRDPGCEPFALRFGDAPRLRYSRRGAAVELGSRTGPFARVVGGLRVEQITATSLPGRAAELDEGGGPSPFVKDGRSTLAALSFAFARDTRDDPFFPRGGTRLDAGLTLGSRAFGGGYDYARILVQGEVNVSPRRDHGLRLQLALGLVQGDAPFFERFYAADWAYFSLGPALGRALDLNFSTDSRYDRILAMGGAEWGIPLWSGGRVFHRGYVALGARAIWSAAESDVSRTHASRTPLSAECALRFDTPVGAFNVSLGYLLDNFQ
jgi:outer membrane protein insertion porin family